MLLHCWSQRKLGNAIFIRFVQFFFVSSVKRKCQNSSIEASGLKHSSACPDLLFKGVM